jgi:HK97 family phage prohead protease
MEFAGSPFEIKALTDSGSIEGLLAGFGNVDHGGDKLLPGSLSKSLATRTTPLPMLLHHDLSRPIGAWKEWQDSSEGLYVKGSMTLSTRDAQEAHALAKDGALTGLSIGWKPLKNTVDSKGVRTITDAELFEGSLVTVPMNDRTRVTAIKSVTNARDIAELLQEAGISGRKAKAAAGAAWKAINDQSETEGLEEIARLFEQHSAKLATIGVN